MPLAGYGAGATVRLEFAAKTQKLDEAIARINSGLDSIEKKRLGRDAEVAATNERIAASYKAIAGSIAAVVAAGITLKKIYDFGEAGAQIERLGTAGSAVASQLGGDYDALITKLRDASSFTVASTDLMLSANQAMMLGLGADAEKLGNLMEIAAFRGRAMGISTTQAFSDIVRGVGRMSPMILDNLGIVVDADKTFGAYAKSIGKSADELTRAEKIQALLNRVLEEGNTMLAQAGGLQDDSATAYERVNAAWTDLVDKIKVDTAEALEPALYTLQAIFGVTPEQRGIETAVEERRQALLTDVDNYKDYVFEMLRLQSIVEGRGGQFDEEFARRLISGEASAPAYASSGVMTESQWKARFLADAAGAGKKGRFGQQPVAAPPPSPIPSETDEQIAAYRDLLDLTFDLQAINIDYTESLEDVREKQAEVADEIKRRWGLTISQAFGKRFIGFGGALGDLKDDYAELEAAAASANAEMNQTQAQKFFDLFQKRLAGTELSAADQFDIATQLAGSLGLLSDDAVADAQAWNEALRTVDTEKPDKLYDALAALDKLPKPIRLSVVLDILTQGGVGGGSAGGGTYIAPPAAGGGGGKPKILAASGWEGTVYQPTTFVVGEGGQPEDVSIVPKSERNKRGGNGDTYISYYGPHIVNNTTSTNDYVDIG